MARSAIRWGRSNSNLSAVPANHNSGDHFSQANNTNLLPISGIDTRQPPPSSSELSTATTVQAASPPHSSTRIQVPSSASTTLESFAAKSSSIRWGCGSRNLQDKCTLLSLSSSLRFLVCSIPPRAFRLSQVYPHPQRTYSLPSLSN
ncbi:hypothetical protein BC835DRAFT_1320934 [Cytidiella melzeri]|nr:hypothetical protein BC835DRAFT_1320934 [Cytidiella melzeri]